MKYRDVKTPAEAIAWADSMDRRWPERHIVRQYLLQFLRHVPLKPYHLVELGPGTAHLACTLLEKLPYLHYSGLDSYQPLLTYAHQQLQAFSQRANLLQTDFSRSDWLTHLSSPVQMIFSMQSLHDLGSAEATGQLYDQARHVLQPGGVLINVDFVQPHPNHPGQISPERHFHLLKQAGFVTLIYRQWGALGWVQGHVAHP